MAKWDLPQLAHWRVLNAGAPGFTTEQIRLRAAELLDQTHPDVVVMEAGINDLKFLGLRPEIASGVVSLALTNLAAIVDECVRRHCKIIVLTTWPAAKPSLARWLVWNNAVPAGVAQLNRQLLMLDSPKNGICVVDLFEEAGLKLGRRVLSGYIASKTSGLPTPDANAANGIG